MALRLRHAAALKGCKSTGRSSAAAIAMDGQDTLATGGWCLTTREESAADPYSEVTLLRNQSYFLPRPHVAADSTISIFLLGLLKVCSTSCIAPMCKVCATNWRYLSMLDFGAGVGQYGHSLLSHDRHYQWMGYDGAGNVEEVTNGFVRFLDLTIPLSLPRADWVLSLEVRRSGHAR